MSVSVTYNGYTLPNQIGKFNLSQDYDRMTFGTNFLVTSSTVSGLVAACSAAESAISEKWEDLVVVFDGNPEYSFSHSANTGFNGFAKISKVGGNLDTELAREYSFSFTCDLPSDKSGLGGRRYFSYSVTFSANRQRSVSFNFEYTATASPLKGSKENFDDNSEGLANIVLTSLGGSYDIVTKNSNTDDQDKVTTGYIEYTEILDSETSSVINDTDIVQANCQYSLDLSQSIGISQTTEFSQTPIVNVGLSYSAKVNRESVSSSTNIEAVYREKVRPWIISHSFDVLGLNNFENAGSSYITHSDSYIYNPTNYTISGSISFSAPRSQTMVVELNEVIRDNIDAGTVYRKLWNGIKNSYAKYTMGSTRTVSRSVSVHQLSSPVSNIAPLANPNLELTRTNSSTSVREIGVGSSSFTGDSVRVFVHQTTFNESYIYINREAVATGGGSASEDEQSRGERVPVITETG